MIVGDQRTGKSTMCLRAINRLYLNSKYNCPYFVDLDVGQNSLTIPGCIRFVEMYDIVKTNEVIVSFYLSTKLIPCLSVCVSCVYICICFMNGSFKLFTDFFCDCFGQKKHSRLTGPTLFFGSVTPSKNLELFIRMVEQLAKKLDDFYVYLARLLAL